MPPTATTDATIGESSAPAGSEPSAPAGGGSTGPTAPTAPTSTEFEPMSTDWVSHRSGDDCRCVDGSEHAIHVRAGDPSKVLLYYQGGGACIDGETCADAGSTYKPGTWPEDHPNANAAGIFAAARPDNPFHGWTMVYVPYCSADFFLGDATTTYAPGITIEHNGATTARRALDHVIERYPEVERLVVAGTSAGAVPTPLIAGLASDALPDASIAVLADGAGAYRSHPGLNTILASSWGTGASIPDWPELDSDAVRSNGGLGIPDLFVLAGNHDPSIRMSRFDDADDFVQGIFMNILDDAARDRGSVIPPVDGDLPTALADSEAAIETAGVPLDVYVAPGDQHTILDRPRLYELEVEGVRFVDWVAEVISGRQPGDVRCPDCGR